MIAERPSFRWSRRVAVRCGGVALGVLAFACTTKPKPPPAELDVDVPPPPPPPSASVAPTPSSRASASAAPSASAGAAPAAPELPLEVALVDPGQEPRRPLRIRLAPGQRFAWSWQEKGQTRYEGTLGGRPPHPAPASRYVFDFVVNGVASDGAGTGQLAVRSAERTVEPNDFLFAGLGAPPAPFGWPQRLTATGLYALEDVPLPSEADPTVQGLLRALRGGSTVPFPEKPLGVGARWTVVRRFEKLGIPVRELTVYELLKLDATGMEFDGLVSASAVPHKLEIAGLAPDEEYHLTRVATLGNVRGKVAFAEPVFELKASGTVKYSVKLMRFEEAVAEGTIVNEYEQTLGRETPAEVAPAPSASAAGAPSSAPPPKR